MNEGRTSPLTGLPLDFRAAVRGLRRAPFLTVAASLTLALGVATNAAVLSYVRGLLLDEPPYPAADELVLVETERGGERGKLSTLEIRDLDETASTLSGVASFRLTQYTASGDGQPEVFFAAMSTHRLAEVLGLQPAVGGWWLRSDDGISQPKIVISDRMWRERYSADPGIVGTSVTLDVYPYQVVGVMPPTFDFPAGTDMWRAAGATDYESRSIRSTRGVARLAPGASLVDAQAELDALAARYAETYPDTNRGIRYVASPLADYWVGEIRPYTTALLVAAVFVLLLAVGNLVHLARSRATDLAPELALRTALGGSKSAVVRPLFIEALLIASVATLLAITVVPIATLAVERVVPFDRPTWMRIEMDWVVVLFGLVLAGGSAALSTVWSTWSILGSGPSAVLRSGRHGPAGTFWRLALPASQVALGTVVALGALALLTTVERLRSVDIGFDPDDLLAVQVDPPWTSYDAVENTAPFYRQVLEEVAAAPGVVAVGSNVALPYGTQDPNDAMDRQLPRLPDQTPDEVAQNPFVNLQVVSPNYLEAMRIPVERGRTFRDSDNLDAPAAAIVSESLARRMWPDEDPLGQRIAISELDANYRPTGEQSNIDWYEVIGVAGDIRQAGILAGPTMDLYVSHEQLFAPETYLVVRTRSDPAATLEAVRAAVERADPLQTIYDVMPMTDRVERTFWRQRLALVLLRGFALLTTVLAAVGIYGVLAREVAMRSRELGVRVALGATPAELRTSVLADAARVGVAGAAIGLVVGLGLVAALATWTAEVRAPGVEWILAVAIGAVVLAVGSATPPALRAARAEPLAILKEG